MVLIHPTAIISEGAELDVDVEVGPYSVIGPHVKIGKGSKIMPHVVLDGYTTIGSKCRIFPFASIGSETQDLKFKGDITYVEIGDRTTLREYVTVNSSTNEGEVTRVGSDCLLMAYCHVAHLCDVGNGVIMANCATLAGHVTVEDQAIVGGLSAVHQFVKIGRLCMIGGCSRVVQDCAPFTMITGNPARARGLNSTGMKRRGIDADIQKHLKAAYRILCRSGLSTTQALDEIDKSVPKSSDIDHFVSFIKTSERGVTK